MTHACVCDVNHACACDVTHACVCVMTHARVCVMTRACVCVMTHARVCVMTHARVRVMTHGYRMVAWMTTSDMSHVCVSDITHACVWDDPWHTHSDWRQVMCVTRCIHVQHASWQASWLIHTHWCRGHLCHTMHLCVHGSFHWEMPHPRNSPNPQPHNLRTSERQTLTFYAMSRYRFKLRFLFWIWICSEEFEFVDLVDFRGDSYIPIGGTNNDGALGLEVVCVTWLIHMCDVDRVTYVMCVMWLFHVCDMTLLICVWHFVVMCVIWLTSVCGMPLESYIPIGVCVFCLTWCIHV